MALEVNIRDGIYGTAIILLITILGVQITDTEGWFYCEIENNLKECSDLTRYGVEDAKCIGKDGVNDICTANGVKYPWKPLDDYIDINTRGKTVVESIQSCSNELENISVDIYGRCTLEKYNLSDCTEYDINGSCNDWNVISYESSCYVSTIIEEVNQTICKPIGYNITYPSGSNYEITGDCCGYFNKTQQIVCKKRIEGICNPVCQQTSPDPNEYDEHCMIYDLLSEKIEPKMVGASDYDRNYQVRLADYKVRRVVR